MEAAELSSEEEKVVGAIAALEASGQATSLGAVANAAALSPDRTRSVLSRLLGELGLVQEVEGDPGGPYYVLSGRAGGETGKAPAGALQGDSVAEQLQRCVGDGPFPTTTEDVVARVAAADLPQPLVQAVKRLPEGQTFVSLEDLVEAVNQRLSG